LRVEDGAAVTEEHGTIAADVVVAATGGRQAPPPGLPAGLELPLHVDASLRVPGHENAHAVGDLVRLPHVRFGSVAFPHWDAAVGTGEQAADAIAGTAGDYERLPYWWSAIGTRRLAEVGIAAAAVEWSGEDRMHVGRAADGSVACALVVDEPRRLRDARRLLLDA
jgi:NADH dehydrogenase FAD-containing subunit